MDTAASVPVPAATVTIVDIFAKQIEMNAQLAVIHNQLQALPDHEARIRVLEAGKARMYGAAAAVSVTVSAMSVWLGTLIIHR